MPLPAWKKILVVDLGFLGDTVHSIPAVRALANCGAEVDVMTTAVGAELLAMVPEVKRVFETWKTLLPYHQENSLGRTWQEAATSMAKGECGLDQYEVRGWTGWHRHVTLSLFALAVVAVIRSRAVAGPKQKSRPV